MTIYELVAESRRIAADKGWHDEERSIPELLCLIHSEVSEALEAYRDGSHGRIERWKGEDGKPEGLESELADVLIRVGDLCGTWGLDLDRAVREKLAYNETRPHRHGGKRI